MQWCILALFFGEEHVDPFWERVKCVVHKELLKSHRSGVHLLSVLSGYVQVTSDSHGYLLCGGSGARWDEKSSIEGAYLFFLLNYLFTLHPNCSPLLLLPHIAPLLFSSEKRKPPSRVPTHHGI